MSMPGRDTEGDAAPAPDATESHPPLPARGRRTCAALVAGSVCIGTARRGVVAGSVEREQRMGAGVPAPDLSSAPGVALVVHVETGAGRADVGADAAAQAAPGRLLSRRGCRNCLSRIAASRSGTTARAICCATRLTLIFGERPAVAARPASSLPTPARGPCPDTGRTSQSSSERNDQADRRPRFPHRRAADRGAEALRARPRGRRRPRPSSTPAAGHRADPRPCRRGRRRRAGRGPPRRS